ncbi:hypothetical protein SAMN04515674_104285 [Pseudarcicella hirudinis]|uniref:Uncharacterized protein n=1 Tax=Pseudarcicella hirudinis TaxID=1079859 RepID=A0A1I5RWQ8_9BACT|nr:hypothetical protein [Pseudarcicella hirudinis]SFP62913.1 hypothetical protein SAMN04515674_104285 [Pseudarcicella hirudinis]
MKKTKSAPKKASTPAKKKAVKSGLTAAQKRIKRISEVATEIQKSGGKTTKTVTVTKYKVSRIDAVKRAAKQVK